MTSQLRPERKERSRHAQPRGTVSLGDRHPRPGEATPTRLMDSKRNRKVGRPAVSALQPLTLPPGSACTGTGVDELAHVAGIVAGPARP